MYLRGQELVDLFLADIQCYPEFQILERGNPLKLLFSGRSFMIYFKCASYAGKPYPQNTTRAQLPRRPEFDNVTEEDVFLFIGYDIDNDVFICWDPIKTKKRLNQKSYVSFFSRKSLQNSVLPGEIKEGYLTNGDKFVLFNRKDIASFFEMIGVHFPELFPHHSGGDTIHLNEKYNEEGYLEDVLDDISVKLLIDEMYSNGERNKLTILSKCMNMFGPYYYNMRLVDWARIVKLYLDDTI